MGKGNRTINILRTVHVAQCEMPTNTAFASLHILIEANLLDDPEGISLPQAFGSSMKYSSYTMYTFNISPEKRSSYCSIFLWQNS